MSRNSLGRYLVPCLGLWLLGCAASSNAGARDPAPPARTEALDAAALVSLGTVTDAQLSPDGAWVVFSRRTPRALDDVGGSRSSLHLLELETGVERRLSGTVFDAWSPQWSPDGATITFLSRRKSHDDHTQIFSIDPRGGEAVPLTQLATGVGRYVWSPSGDRIGFTATRPWSDDERRERDAGRDWIVNETNTRGQQLFILDPATGEATAITDAGLAVTNFAWHPRGERLVFSAATSATVDATMMYGRIYTVPVRGGTPEPLCETAGKLGRMSWSPDGDHIAFLGALDIHDSTAGTVFVVPAGGGSPRNLTPDFEGTAQWIGWRDADTLVVSSHERTESTVRTLELESGRSRLLVEDGPTCRALSLNRERDRFACAGSRPTHPPEVFAGTLKSGKSQRRTITNPSLEQVKLGAQRVYTWKGKDGLDLQGILILPPDHEDGQRHPLAVLPHGGPEGVSLNGWNSRATYPAQIMAAEGYVVFEPNYRGSSGRGTAFAVADQQDLGGLEFEDVLAGVDALIAEGLVDADRVGMGGWSYGGYFSGLAATRWTDRFRAAVISAAVTDWMSFTGTTEIEHENSLVHWKLWPYEHAQKVWDRSPMGHTTGSTTASLIVHGLADTRVPPSQSTELYRALKHAGAPVELVMYPREPHGLRENVHQLDFVNRFVAWFNRYVRDASTAPEKG